MSVQRALRGLSWSGENGVYKVEGDWSILNLGGEGWLATSGDGRQEEAKTLQGVGDILRELKGGGAL